MAAQQNVISLDAYRLARRPSASKAAEAARPMTMPVVCWVPFWFMVAPPPVGYWPAPSW